MNTSWTGTRQETLMNRPNVQDANDDEVVDIRARRLIATLFRLELISSKTTVDILDLGYIRLYDILWKYKQND